MGYLCVNISGHISSRLFLSSQRLITSLNKDVHARLVQRGRYSQTLSDIIRELLDMADKMEGVKGKK